MLFMAKTKVLVGFVVVGILLQGCWQMGNVDVIAETEEKHYQRAQRLLREGREQEALSAFLKVVEKRQDAPESHLEAGRLYASYIGDPLAAIYHYRKFLELKPHGKQAPLVQQLIGSSKKMFARQLPGQPLGDSADRLDLLTLLEEMRAENIELKQHIASLQADLAQAQHVRPAQDSRAVAMNLERLQTMPMVSQPRTSAPAVTRAPAQQMSQPQQPVRPALPATYTVQSGDSLYSISKRMYGTSGRYMDIYQVNRDRMRAPDALRVGMVLKIPR